MARHCAVDGCERTPGSGWSRCDSHVRQWLDRLLAVEWLDRLLGVEWREIKESPEVPPDAHLEDWAPGEVVEVFGK